MKPNEYLCMAKKWTVYRVESSQGRVEGKR